MAAKKATKKAPGEGEKPKKTAPAQALEEVITSPVPQAKQDRRTTESAATALVAELNTDGIRLHGKEFVGKVISDKMQKTVVVEWERRRLVRKFERYERRFSRVYAHNPGAISAKIGDTVRVKETRPLSKTKHFVVVEVLA